MPDGLQPNMIKPAQSCADNNQQTPKPTNQDEF